MAGAGQVMDAVSRDPLTDLNACHEMEKTLKPKLLKFPPSANTGSSIWRNYMRILCEVSQSQGTPVYHATAAQRAEAFLRTLNLWTDQKGTM